MKAADIPDDMMIAAVRMNARGPLGRATRDSVTAEIRLRLGEVPEQVVRAKHRSMVRRKILGGCWCGCLGDWHVLEDTGDGRT